MARRSGAVHVATTTRRHNGKTYHSHLLRRTFRQDGKVKHETLGNISHLPDDIIALVRRALKGETLVNPDLAFQCVRSLPHGHVAAVLGTIRKLGLHTILARTPSRHRELVTAMIVARVITPRSKLATARALTPQTAMSTLGETLNLGEVDENELYGALDWLGERQAGIEARLARRHLSENTLVLYDLTSTWVEGRHCPLAQRGYRRDGQPGTLQIVFGLLCSANGCPVAVEVFEGSTADPRTVAPQIEKLRSRFGLEQVVVVGDRGMLTAARIREDLKGVPGLRWITALRSSAIRQLVEAGKVPRSLFDERGLAEITSKEFPGERLIGCRNPRLLAERRRKREDLLAATERRLEEVAAATRRKKRPLRGEAAIGLRVGRVIGRHKMAKHFVIKITATGFSFQRDLAKIAAEEELDGLYVVRTNVEPTQFDASQTVRAYKSRSRVERAFRSLKSVDLKVRPIHHRRPDRVRAHVLLCVLAYYVEWHMRQDLAPLLFDDHDRPAAEARSSSVVAPAQRFPAAVAKASRRRTEDDLPVHSFRTLLSDLGTLTANTMRVTATEHAFNLHTQPTPVQARSFELLGLTPRR